jgi:hypothetical protein
MSGIDFRNLTTAELVHYAWLMGPDKLPPNWVEELIKRLEQTLDDNK